MMNEFHDKVGEYAEKDCKSIPINFEHDEHHQS
jgi:hypothetical protein